VLELGAGCGLVGLHLAMLGYEVVLADRGDEALEILRQNVQANKLHVTGKVEVASYAWAESIAVFGADPFDIIIASDCVYLTNDYAQLVVSLKLLAEKGSRNSRVIIANHTTACAPLDDFWSLMGEAGFEVASLPETLVDLTGCNVEGSQGIGIFVAHLTPVAPSR
jgi:predicted nicotinamide N-methyase